MNSANIRLNEELVRYINLKLAALGQPTSVSTSDRGFLEIVRPLLRNYYEKDRLLEGVLAPADARIQQFLNTYLADACPGGAARLPRPTFVLDRPGLARAMSLPPTGNYFASPYLQSYRTAQGVLHNPKSDRRTTQGLFHIVEGGLPVPADKAETPKAAFAALLARAFQPPPDVLTLPFTADQPEAVHVFVSLLLRPIVCPATARDPDKRMEIRFFAPGSLVSNLDFVEGIFGNGGDPYLPENDAGLDALHWTGHTGCVILAPHLAGTVTKRELSLPHFDNATERQRRDGMCWRNEDELYNGGKAFKVTCRDESGTAVTIIAESYYGYCKKEVKTQISFAANLYGLCEEEHAGGAIAFPAYVLGQEFFAERTQSVKQIAFEDGVARVGDRVRREPGGYAVDLRFPEVFYVPHNAVFSVPEGRVRWVGAQGEDQGLTLRAGDVYVLPSGFRVRLAKQIGGTSWRLVGTSPHCTLCHKPSTVSGGGKSEISKSIADVVLQGPVFVRDYKADMDEVATILQRDFSTAYRQQPYPRASRPILSQERSLGSVIQLLTPSADFTDEYNDWLRALPQTIRQLVFTVKRYYRPEWGDAWREHFTVDRIDGFLGHELKFDNRKLVGNYLRVGFDGDGNWRIFKLRRDFHPADKVQVEDDITASVVLPRSQLPDVPQAPAQSSVKLVKNCETLLFQRPDEAIHRGFDKQAESDISAPGVFLSNFEPLTREQVRGLVDRVVEFDEYTPPMRDLLSGFAAHGDGEYVVSSAHPRMVDGKPSKNPRYLQRRPDVVHPREPYLAEISQRLFREVPSNSAVHFPVDAVLAGRRGSPPDDKIGLPPLAVYGPIHYQELPELFMDFLCSLTGKSPSTTGFGSEGALTKGPFNMLWPVVDMNNALLCAILTGYAGYTTSAGTIGHQFRVDHDISLLVPEIWCRLFPHEKDPEYLKAGGFLEKLDDFVFEGRTVKASRLGYRITSHFTERFLGRIFETPDKVFPEEMLRPERQDLAAFAAGVDAIVESQKRVAQNYFDDRSVEAACPPLKALLHIMVHGLYQGHDLQHPDVRSLFDHANVLRSDWYQERLRVKQERDIALWRRIVSGLDGFRTARPNGTEIGAAQRLTVARRELQRVCAPGYVEELIGTIGADPFRLQLARYGRTGLP
ncbi:MAG: hypothetical protein ABTD50_03720 [Polyangiaceae bacterium]|jgi:hypothetical protein